MEFDGQKLESLNYFFTGENRIDNAPNTINVSIFISININNKLN